MKFTIITHSTHKIKDNLIYAYEPYVREMNLWLKHSSEVKIIAPISNNPIRTIDSNYQSKRIIIQKIPAFNIIGFKNKIISIFKIPIIIYQIAKAMFWADHIHLRCPGNIGLLGVLIQIFFPKTPKTAKYAGNWDPNSKQPWSYRFQKWVLSNPFLTKNIKVLVYGNWNKQTKNIYSFFTASYKKSEITLLKEKNILGQINCIYVGAFSKSKQPILSVKIIEKLKNRGFNITLNMYGDGEEFDIIKKYITDNNLDQIIFQHGNQSKEVIKATFQKSHFLIFLSKSEGWPKVVAESMFWSCLPISTRVSCVPYMLGNGNRGILVADNVDDVVFKIEPYLENNKLYQKKILNAKNWSQQYTLDYFEEKIKELL